MPEKQKHSKEGHSDPVVHHNVDTPPEEALKYWTRAKKRKAKPIPMPEVNNLEPENKQPKQPRQ
jgi:hypothetical protein